MNQTGITCGFFRKGLCYLGCHKSRWLSENVMRMNMFYQLRQKLKCLALADAILAEEWQYRYFSYNSKWSDTEEMASLRDGSGAEWFLWFSGQLAGYKCMSPEDGFMPALESVKATIPPEYKPFITEPAFSMDRATCI